MFFAKVKLSTDILQGSLVSRCLILDLYNNLSVLCVFSFWHVTTIHLVPQEKSSMTEASNLVWLTSSSNHAVNGGSVFSGESPSGTLKTPGPSKGGVDWNPIPPIQDSSLPLQ